MGVTEFGTEERFAINPFAPSFLRFCPAWNPPPSTPIRLTVVAPETPVSTTPYAFEVSCLIISPADTVIATDNTKVSFVIAVRICLEVATGVATAFVDL